MKVLFIITLFVTSLFGDMSTDLLVNDVTIGYNIIWSTPSSPVTLIRGDFDYSYMIFVETTVYSGLESSFSDTIGNKNTKYYIPTHIHNKFTKKHYVEVL